MASAGAEAFLQVMYRIEYFTLERVWTDLTDDELFWEPTSTSWSVRRRGEARTANPLGAGEWVADFEVPEPTPNPMTTIGWLLWHAGSLPGRFVELDLAGGTRTMASGWTSPYLTDHPVFTTAADAAGTLRAGWEALRRAVESMSDEHLASTSARYTYGRGEITSVHPLGAPGPEHPVSFFVAGALNEVSHHGSQICVLRDLYAARSA